MRMLILPVALALGALLYTLLPAAKKWIEDGLCALYAKVQQLFTTKRGKTDSRSATAVYFLAIAAGVTLLSAIQPVVAALITAPVFAGFAQLPAAVGIKQELHGGKYAKDIPAYEQKVIDACAPLGDAVAKEIAAPMLLFALGTPLYLGGTLSWLYVALRAVRAELPAAQRILVPLERAGDAAVVALLHLCAGLVGRNPLVIGGRGAGQKLMHILSLEGERDHAPIAGDITQGVFLGCLCVGLLCAVLTVLGVLML